jgi:FtsX-like permease family
MRVTGVWLRLDLRRHWLSLVVLMVLIAVAAAAAMAALAGARRAASAQQRLLARTLPATVQVNPYRPGFDWSAVSRLPEVAAIAPFIFDSYMAVDALPPQVFSLLPTDDSFGRTVEKPIVDSGRMFDPTRADEAVVTRRFVSHYHKGVGDTVVVHLPTAQGLLQAGTTPFGANTAGGLIGPAIVVHIVGVVESWYVSDGPGSTGYLQLSPGLVARYPQNTVGDQTVLGNPNPVDALVRLRNGEADVAKFSSDLRRLDGGAQADVGDLPAQVKALQRQIAFEAGFLVAFALAVMVAAGVLVGQAIARTASARADELAPLRAIGSTRAQSSVLAAAAPTVAGLVGAVIGALIAYAASEWMPIGTAAVLEPSPGLSWDWTVIGPGIGIVASFVATTAYLAATATMSRRLGQLDRRSLVVRRLARLGCAVPVVMGARFALERARGRTSLPVWPALVASVVGVAGIIAALTISQAVSDAAANPSRFGENVQLGALTGSNGAGIADNTGLITALAANPTITGVDNDRQAVATAINGSISIDLSEYDAEPKPIPMTILSGRLPQKADEIVLGPRSLRALHAHIGSTVHLSGTKAKNVAVTVTGTGLVGNGVEGLFYDEGGWVTAEGFDSLFTTYVYRIVLVALQPQARNIDAPNTVKADLSKRTQDLGPVKFDASTPVLYQESGLPQVRTLPTYLAVFLALLGVAAIGHVLAGTSRRRSHYLAIMRAVGMTPTQTRWVLVSQACTVAAIGLIFGVPLGLAVGRTIWRWVADYSPLQYVPPTPVLTLVLIGPLTLLLATLIAIWPARTAAKLDLGRILRSE